MDTPEHERMPKVIIRTASLADVTDIRKMHAKSWVDTYPNEEAGVTREWLLDHTAQWLTPEGLEGSQEHFRAIFGNPDHFYRVASDGKSILGMAHASVIDGSQHLEAMYTDKSQHGTGLAQKMMDSVFEWLDLSKPIVLEVASYNKRAIAFYRKYGFEIDEGSEQMFKGNIQTVRMTRRGDVK